MIVKYWLNVGGKSRNETFYGKFSYLVELQTVVLEKDTNKNGFCPGLLPAFLKVLQAVEQLLFLSHLTTFCSNIPELLLLDVENAFLFSKILCKAFTV